VLEAPHVFVEDLGLESIREAAAQYEGGRLKRALERHHGGNVECAFWGWNEVWLDPEFRSWNIEEYLSGVSVSMLVIQGEQDEYGTLRQVEAIERGCGGRVESVVLPGCGHSPHRDQPEHTIQAIASFVRGELSNTGG
jgi:pimeloyl-ACP methyl ester carboxylesterase